MRIPGKTFSLLLGSHYAVEPTICKKIPKIHSLISPDQGEVFLEEEQLPRYYSKNRVASAQFLTYVAITGPAAAVPSLRPSFFTAREKLRLTQVETIVLSHPASGP